MSKKAWLRAVSVLWRSFIAAGELAPTNRCREFEQGDAPVPGRIHVLTAFFIIAPLIFTNPSLSGGSGVSPDLNTGHETSHGFVK